MPTYLTRCSAGVMRWLLGSASGLLLAASALAHDAPGAVAAVRVLPTDASAVSASVAQTVWGILGYTRWPESGPVLQLCVAGETPHATLLLAGSELPNGRTVHARKVQLESAQPLQGCHALYAGRLGADQWKKLMTTWPSGHALLTLSEELAACQQGGMFCLSIAPHGVSFELNLDSVARSGVRLNPRVLGLARRKEGS